METQTQTENFTLYDHAPTYTQPILFLNEDESVYTTMGFEHNELGDEYAGGLWFKGKNLVDYDGVYALPKEIQQWLINNDYTFNNADGTSQFDYDIKQLNNLVLF